MASVTPAPFSACSAHSTADTPSTGNSGFGTVSVAGRSRVPSPAASTIAFI